MSKRINLLINRDQLFLLKTLSDKKGVTINRLIIDSIDSLSQIFLRESTTVSIEQSNKPLSLRLEERSIQKLQYYSYIYQLPTSTVLRLVITNLLYVFYPLDNLLVPPRLEDFVNYPIPQQLRILRECLASGYNAAFDELSQVISFEQESNLQLELEGMLMLSERERRRLNWLKSEELCKTTIERAQESSLVEIKTKAQLKLATIFYDKADLEQSINVGKELILKSELLSNSQLVFVNLDLARAYYEIGEEVSSDYYFEMADTVVSDSLSKRLKLLVHLERMKVLINSDSNTGITESRKAIEISERLGLDNFTRYFYGYYSLCLFSRGEYSQAIEAMRRCIKYSRVFENSGRNRLNLALLEMYKTPFDFKHFHTFESMMNIIYSHDKQDFGRYQTLAIKYLYARNDQLKQDAFIGLNTLHTETVHPVIRSSIERVLHKKIYIALRE